MNPRPVRIISFDDLRDATEAVAMADVADDELSEIGVPLDHHGVLMDGLGPSHYALIELEPRCLRAGGRKFECR